MIFIVRQIQEKCTEQDMGLYAVFTDLTKAFDAVNKKSPLDSGGAILMPKKTCQHPQALS